MLHSEPSIEETKPHAAKISVRTQLIVFFILSFLIAWLAWLCVHILFLIGFRNRLIVMIQWAWSYFTYERGARLITGDSRLPSWAASHPAKPQSEALPLPKSPAAD